MHPYISVTKEDEKEMLSQLGMSSIDELFKLIPDDLKLNRALNLEESKSEHEIVSLLSSIASENKILKSFRGVGAYDHLIPSYVKHLLLRSEFYTAYTPYQPEISQGTLQAIFEFQTMIAELTGLDVSNASMYDGASAAAEAAMIAAFNQKGDTIVISGSCHPELIEVVKTYMRFLGVNVVVSNVSDLKTDMNALSGLISDSTLGVIVQNPNYFGVIEDYSGLSEKVHDNKALLIMSVDPISLAILKTPAEYGADIAVGEGQVLGNALNYGGPYLGFMAATNKLMRKLPGRIVGQTEDLEGKRAFTLTLQAREQHIRRDKATSNICSNQALCALAATIYLSSMGKEGLIEVANQNVQNSYYTYHKLLETKKFEKVSDAPFFREFTLKTKGDVLKLNKVLSDRGYLGGYVIEDGFGLGDGEKLVVFAVTEKRTKEEIDEFVQIVTEVNW